MLGYDLLKRSVSMLICYDNPEGETLSAEIPVFPVGLNQLCNMFGLLGHDKTRANNRHNPFFGKPASGCYVIVSGATCPSMYDYIRGVFFHDAYDSISECVEALRNYLEVDAEEPYCYQPATTQYEIWQVCDDYELWHRWQTDVNSTYARRAIMSDDYVQALRIESCAACGKQLDRPYTLYVHGRGYMCWDCWRLIRTYGDRVFDDDEPYGYVIDHDLQDERNESLDGMTTHERELTHLQKLYEMEVC